MRLRPGLLACMMLLAIAALVSAQEETATASETSIFERLRELIQMPAMAERTRESGISIEDVRIILEESQRRQLPPDEATKILEECETAARENGPVDNFGAFVQARLDEGLRGRDLAAAIHAEHAARGKGKAKPKVDAHGEEAAGEHGRSDEAKKKGKGNG